MSFKKFCPKCGKETDTIVNKVCLDCFNGKEELFTVNKIHIYRCKKCQKLLVSGRWHDFSEEEIAHSITGFIHPNNQLLETKIFVELQKFDSINYEALIKIKGILNLSVIEQEKAVKFQVKETLCDSCMKIGADYREAIIQLRSDSKDTYEEMFLMAKQFLEKEKEKDSLNDASKIIKLKTGYDLWIGSKKAAIKVSRKISKILKIEMIVTDKLVGEDDQGKRKYRHTFLLRK